MHHYANMLRLVLKRHASSQHLSWLTAASQVSRFSTDIPLESHQQPAPSPLNLQLEPETPLLHSIRNRIMIKGGPLSVAEYMQEVLTNPAAGFYMHRDVFGQQGDFITSPEISQMFGELLGVWCVMIWQQLGQPGRLNLVELGPGRGTLMSDLLRGTSGFKGFSQALNLHLVEVSPTLREQQWEVLRCRAPPEAPLNAQHHGLAPVSTSTLPDSSCSSSRASNQQGEEHQQSGDKRQHMGSDTGSSKSISSSSSSSGQGPGPTGISGWNGAQVMWHSLLATVPADAPSIYLAHEFLDALPVHQFVKDPQRGWLELMVDTAEGGEGAAPHHLRFVLSPSPTPASAVLVPRRMRGMREEEHKNMQALEVGAQAMVLMEQLAQRISQHSGAALLIDYGQAKPYSNSLTAIRKHQGVHPLSQPGTADLSAWVDFQAMRLAAEEAVVPGDSVTSDTSDTTSSSSGGTDERAAAAVVAVEGSGSSRGQAAGPSVRGSEGRGDCEGRGVDVYGPVPQGHLLLSLGIQTRVEMLAQAATTESQVEGLVKTYERLVQPGPEGMGSSYQALAIVSKGLSPPVGFEEQPAAEPAGQ